MDFFLEIGRDGVAFFRSGLEQVIQSGLHPSPWGVALCLLVLTLWLGSACWMASIAESRLYPPVPFFFRGLLQPVVGPWRTFLYLEIRPANPYLSPEEQVALAAVTAVGAAGPAAAALAVPVAVAVQPVAASSFNQDFFRAYQYQWEKTPEVAPHLYIRFGGVELLARRVLEALPKVVLIEIEDAEGRPQKVRVPYDKMSEVKIMGSAAVPQAPGAETKIADHV